MRDGWREARLGDVAVRRNDFTAVEAETLYRVVGVQRSGWGLVDRDPVRGDSMKFDKLLRLNADDLVYRTITAFEAPSAVVPSGFEGAFVTPQTFPTYVIDRSQLLPAYMAVLTTSPEFHEAMSTRCVGTVLRRKTLSQGAFESIPLVLPSLDEQRRIVDLVSALDDAVEAAEVEVQGAEKLVESTRDLRIWSCSEDRVALSNVARVVGRLVPPTGEAASLPHIGTDRIESITGRLIGVRSAAEDQVISGKYLHEAGAVIYSKIRPNLRKVAIPTWRGLCSADAYPMLPTDDGSVSFLRHLLVSRPFTDSAVARSGRTKMPKINRTELMSIEVPEIGSEQQVGIAADLDAMSDAADAARATAESLRSLRANLLTVLLSGEHEIPSSYDALVEGEAA